MRPEEIDYSDKRNHYFDISNGEVLAGVMDRARYIKTGGDQNFVFDIGPLLRDPQLFIEADELPYEPLDTTGWQPARYRHFAKWLDRLVDSPDQPDEKKITKTVFNNARVLGVGPGAYMIQKEFGSYSELYADAKILDSQATSLLKDWDVDKAVAYIKRAGQGSRPSYGDLKDLHESNPRNPNGKALHRRFAHIGGFKTLVGLAGYPVIELWDRQDYVDWGVKFMQANDGQVPRARMMRYMAATKRGPSEMPLGRFFDGVGDFQEKAAEQFHERQKEEEQATRHHLDDIGARLEDDRLPVLLFSPLAYEPDQESDPTSIASVQPIVDEIGVPETLIRYAKYKVLETVALSMPTDTKVRIARGVHEGMSFIRAIRRHNDVTAGDIECEALLSGVFDYIWPMDDHMETLKLGEGYEEYCAEHYKPRPRSSRRSALAA